MENLNTAVEIKFKRLTDEATLPRKGSAGAACFDLYATSCDFDGTTITCKTGLAVELPQNYVMLIFSRSGQGFKYGVHLVNGTGVIDADYRGEIMVKLTAPNLNTLGRYYIELTKSDTAAIAQALFVPLPAVRLVEVGDLSNTERGENGFGSTGI